MQALSPDLVGGARLAPALRPPTHPAARMSSKAALAVAPQVLEWDFRWQFVRRRKGRRGQFVRVRVVGIPPWPPMKVSRSNNWGWHLDNEWCERTNELRVPRCLLRHGVGVPSRSERRDVSLCPRWGAVPWPSWQGALHAGELAAWRRASDGGGREA